MRRVLAYALAVVSIPVGVRVGLWIALLTYLPPCVGKGLGTIALCAARPSFQPWVGVVCGGAAATVLLLASVTVSRHATRVGVFDVAAAAAGIAVGLVSSLMTYTYSPCEPSHICVNPLVQRFPTWESALIGLAATFAILLAGAVMNPQWRRVNIRAARTVERWLFNDLSTTSPVGGSGPHVG